MMDYATDRNGKPFSCGAIVKHGKTGEKFSVWGVHHTEQTPRVLAMSEDLEIVKPGPLDHLLKDASKTHTIVWGNGYFSDDDGG